MTPEPRRRRNNSRSAPNDASGRLEDLQTLHRRSFPAFESGRTYQARDNKGDFMANAALGSRKDLRDAVVAARKGAAWSKATAYNRGQVIYRIAEMLRGRRTEFIELIMISTGASTKIATAEVDVAIDRLVHYAGWTDKLAAVLGSANPVSSPHFSYSARTDRSCRNTATRIATTRLDLVIAR